MNIPSKILENAVYEISRLPGIGKSTALRLALYLIKSDSSEINDLINSVKALHENLKSCKNCHNLSDSEICDICNSSLRDDSLICVVEDIRDIMAIENTGQFNGLYHVLNGKISPLNDHIVTKPQDHTQFCIFNSIIFTSSIRHLQFLI